MSELIVFDPADQITTGAVGTPGERTFLIQAQQGDATLTVVVEKEQVAMLAARLLQLLAELEAYLPDDPDAGAATTTEAATPPSGLPDDPDPLFRARMMRLGFDVSREMVVLELFEDVPEEVADPSLADEEAEEIEFEPEGHVARIFATRAQMRAVAVRGAEAVASGRPLCRLCMLPMDPDGHDCPSRN